MEINSSYLNGPEKDMFAPLERIQLRHEEEMPPEQGGEQKSAVIEFNKDVTEDPVLYDVHIQYLKKSDHEDFVHKLGLYYEIDFSNQDDVSEFVSRFLESHEIDTQDLKRIKVQRRNTKW